MDGNSALAPLESAGVRKPRGRKGNLTKLTPAVQEKICAALRSGAYRQTAVHYAGISIQAFQEWMAKGREGRPFWRDFLEAVEKAEADFIIASVGTIRKASTTQWQAAAWMLERKFPELYGQRQRMPLVQEDDKPIPFVMLMPGQVSADAWAADPSGLLEPPATKPDPRRADAVDAEDEAEIPMKFPAEAPADDGDDEPEPEEPEDDDLPSVEPDYGDKV